MKKRNIVGSTCDRSSTVGESEHVKTIWLSILPGEKWGKGGSFCRSASVSANIPFPKFTRKDREPTISLQSLVLRHLWDLSLIVAFAVFSGTTYAQALSRAGRTISPVGTWHSTINMIAGVLAGQQEQADFTFTSDGTVSAITTTGITGTGTWKPTSPMSFFFQFDQRIFANGQVVATVHVVSDAIMTDNGNRFIAYAQSTITDPNGNVTPGDIAIVKATRA